MWTFLNNRNFRWITISDWISVFGDAVFYLAMIAYVSNFENSDLAISLVSIAELLPVTLSCICGYWVDKTAHKVNADFLSAVFRAFLYGIAALIFWKYTGWIVLYIVLIINIISDLLGVYSDNLRFPEIYAIVKLEEFESSAGFSAAVYNIADIIGKMSGGIILVLLNYRFACFALLNSMTFALCALCIFRVKKSVEKKIEEVESKTKKEDKSNFFKECATLLKDKSIIYVVFLVMAINGIVVAILPIVYILLAKNIFATEQYTLLLTVINITSIIGTIFGNILCGSLFKKKYLTQWIMMEAIAIVGLIIAIIKWDIPFLILGILIVFFFQGGVSIKFTAFLFSRQKYTSLGMSVGITNTLLTVSNPLILGIISFLGNIFNFYVSLAVLLGIALCYIVFMLSKRGGMQND